MKRVVRASKYSDKSNHAKNFLKFYASVLVDACNAETSEDFEDIAAKLGVVGKYIKDSKSAIKYAVEQVDDMASEYLLSAGAESKYPEVRDTIVDYLKGLGCDMLPTNAPNGYDEAYVIIPSDEATFEDLKTVASAVSHDYGIKPDTGVIGGSWTAYGFKMDGVKFKIGFIGDDDSLLIAF